MRSNCLNCSNWQGNRHSEFGLCNCYCSLLEPRLYDMTALIPLKRFCVPFDIHDLKYFYVQSRIRKTLENIEIPNKVRRVIRNEKDLKFIINKDGIVIGERVIQYKVVYFYTHKTFNCEHFKRGKA